MIGDTFSICNKHIIKEKFVLKNSDNTKKEPFPDEMESMAPLLIKEDQQVGEKVNEQRDDQKEKKKLVELSEEEIANLKNCRSRAYGKVNQKKRLHLTPSLPQYLLKEWQAQYPESPLDAKQLMVLHDNLVEDKEEGRRSCRNRKRKRLSPVPKTVSTTEKTEKKPKKEEKASNKKTTNDNVTMKANHGEVLSEADHGDRNWTPAMLHNLLYANDRAVINNTNIEQEWKMMYPRSVLTARNLKSR